MLTANNSERHQPYFSMPRTATCFLLLCLTAGCGQSPDMETSRKFQDAEKQFAVAEVPAEFAKAAALHQEILDSGFHSGTIFYNQGNAWMQAGQKGRAIASYRQAKRFLPRDPYLDANLRQALAGQPQEAGTSLLNYVFFWQTSVSYQEKAALTTTMLAIALLCTLMQQLNRQPAVTRRIAAVSFVVTALLGISAARDWWKFEHTKHGVVVASEVTARKGGSESYEPAFNQPLREGTEFIVLATNDEWLHIAVGDSGDGWLPHRACVTW